MRNQKVNLKKKPNGVYRVWWDEYDNLETRHQRSKTFRSFKKAEEFRRKVVDKLLVNLTIQNKITLKDYFMKWMKIYIEDRKSINTEYNYYSLLKNHIYPKLGHIKLLELRSFHLQLFIHQMNDLGYKQKTISTILGLISSGLKQAYRDEIIFENPINKLDRIIGCPRKISSNKEQHSLSKAQIKVVVNHFKGHILYLPVIISIYLGLRRGEISALRWDDIDFSSGLISVLHSEVRKVGIGIITTAPKTKTSVRIISIPAFLLKELRSYDIINKKMKLVSSFSYNKNNYLWINKSGMHLSLDYMSQAFKKEYDILHKLNPDFPKISFHGLRHTNATLMAQAGISDKIRAIRLGHANTRITNNIYTHITVHEDRAAIQKLEKLLT